MDKNISKNFSGDDEGGAGIHFPHTPFSSRPARANFFAVFLPAAKGGGQFQDKFRFLHL